MQNLNRLLPNFIFWSRWLQMPLYLGLIIALGVYIFEFAHSLWGLIINAASYNETEVMLNVLNLIDVVMIANLLIMVIVGGYETFVSRLNLHNHPDQPEWLDEVNAGTMKIKLAMALIGISSIHLLRTFIDPSQMTNDAIMWQVVIHLTLVVSAIAIAFTNKFMASTTKQTNRVARAAE
jgi:uncharacterized protein (TIGR00645 family)